MGICYERIRIIAFFSWLLFKSKMSLSGLSGLVVGLFGVLLIMLQRVEKEYEILGITLCLLGLLATTFSTLIITKINIKPNTNKKARACPTPNLLNKVHLKREARKYWKKFPTNKNYETYTKYRNQVVWEQSKSV